MRIAMPVLLVLLSSSVHADTVTVSFPAARPALRDGLTATTTTTIQRGKATTTKTDVLRFSVEAVAKGKVTRAKACAVSTGFPDVCFEYDPTAEAGARVTHEDTWDQLTAAQRALLEGRAAALATRLPSLAGRTFEPSVQTELGGDELGVWGDPHVGLTYQKLVAEEGIFLLTTHTTVKLKDGAKVSGELSGTMHVDATTGRTRSITVEGDLANADGSVTVHVTQASSFVFEEITWD